MRRKFHSGWHGTEMVDVVSLDRLKNSKINNEIMLSIGDHNLNLNFLSGKWYKLVTRQCIL